MWRGPRRERVDLLKPADFQAISGKGVTGTVDGHAVALGNLALLQQLRVDPGPLAARAEELRADGQTVMFVAVDAQPAGLLAVADPIKATTVEAIRQLHAEGLQIVMLTGDNRTTAEAVARRLGIDDVVADVLPDQKADAVKRLQAEGRVVAMAGDGINDAPALAQAQVGHRHGHRHRRGHGERRRDAREGRPDRHRPGPASEPGDDGEHQAEPVLRVRLQRAGRAAGGRRALSRSSVCS